jgi:hypothetical protein
VVTKCPLLVEDDGWQVTVRAHPGELKSRGLPISHKIRDYSVTKARTPTTTKLPIYFLSKMYIKPLEILGSYKYYLGEL